MNSRTIPELQNGGSLGMAENCASEGLSASPCKRDALPAELTARSRISAHLREFPEGVNAAETEQDGNGRNATRPPVPNYSRTRIFTMEEMQECADATDFDAGPLNYPRPPAGHLIYFVGGTDGPIKIGFTQQPIKARLKCIQNGSPVKLHVLATLNATKINEKAYHKRFAAHRLHGEWFERHPDILAEIERLSEGSASPNPLLSGDSPNG